MFTGQLSCGHGRRQDRRFSVAFTQTLILAQNRFSGCRANSFGNDKRNFTNPLPDFKPCGTVVRAVNHGPDRFATICQRANLWMGQFQKSCDRQIRGPSLPVGQQFWLDSPSVRKFANDADPLTRAFPAEKIVTARGSLASSRKRFNHDSRHSLLR